MVISAVRDVSLLSVTLMKAFTPRTCHQMRYLLYLSAVLRYLLIRYRYCTLLLLCHTHILDTGYSSRERERRE